MSRIAAADRQIRRHRPAARENGSGKENATVSAEETVRRSVIHVHVTTMNLVLSLALTQDRLTIPVAAATISSAKLLNFYTCPFLSFLLG